MSRWVMNRRAVPAPVGAAMAAVAVLVLAALPIRHVGAVGESNPLTPQAVHVDEERGVVHVVQTVVPGEIQLLALDAVTLAVRATSPVMATSFAPAFDSRSGTLYILSDTGSPDEVAMVAMVWSTTDLAYGALSQGPVEVRRETGDGVLVWDARGERVVFFARAGTGEAVGDGTADTGVTDEGVTDEGAEQEIVIEVTDPVAGEFVWSVTGSGAPVLLGEAIDAGDHWRFVGSIHPIIVSDTRPGGPPWSITGQVSDFQGGLSGRYLGWQPTILEPGAGAGAGPVVPSGFGGGDGLRAVSALAQAGAGHDNGTAVIGADLTLLVPLGTPAGTYRATLTLTALG